MSPFVNTLLKVAGVLVVLFLIAAVLFPIFATDGSKNPRASCASNMKQLGLGLVQYAQDNDEMMPNISDRSGVSTWRTVIMPYTKVPTLFQCPSRDASDHDANPVGVDGFVESYAANDAGSNGRMNQGQGRGAFAAPGSTPISFAMIPSPQNLIALTETAYNPAPDYNIDNVARFSPESRRLWAGHNGYSNYLFLDDHVKALRPEATDQEASVQVIQNLWYRDGTQPLSANGIVVLQDAQQRFKP